MSDMPHGWAGTTIGEICDLVNGKAFKPSDWSASGLPIVRIQNLNRPDNKFNHFDGTVDERFLIEDGDLLFAWSGTPGTSFGAHIWNGPKAVLNQHIFNVRFDRNAFDRNFLRHAINQTLDEQIAKAHGGVGLRHVTKGKFEETEVPIPPLPEQRRIVAKIDSLTGKSRRARDHLDHIPRLVEKYKQTILAAAFRGDLCTKRRSPKLLPLSEFIDSLDQGWSPKCASEPAGLNDWGVIKTTAIQSVHFLPQENKRLPTDLKPRPGIVINAGDVLTTRAGPRSRVAISCLVNEDHPKLMLCDKAYRLRINQEMADPAFVTYMLNTPQCLSELEVMKTGISDSGLNLTQGKFIALGIPAFSLPEQSEIVCRIQSAFVWIDRLAADAISARKLIDHLDQSVLAKAFKGELVPQDPADEPASALLDRIRAERSAAPKAKRGRKKAA
ncbi:MAG: restriction endonuclease subunit S [Acetobacter sp.]|uniref:restriction endonuclease subunit S n=1 Tax=Acetobacter sp. TaxID=440 RepID=UPI0039E88DEF